MTTTFLTLNSKLCDINSLIVPTEAPDVKSALRDKWSLWVQTDVIDPKKQGIDYKDSTKNLVSFDTIESFWSVFNSVPQPSQFLQGGQTVALAESSNGVVSSLMIFRDGVAPEWEDPVNQDGGHFQYHWKSSSILPAQLDEYWNNLVLALVGNTIESEGEFASNQIVQGVRFVDKRKSAGKQAGLRIEVWFSKATDPRHLQKIRSKLEKAMTLHLDGSTSPSTPRCDVRYHSTKNV